MEKNKGDLIPINQSKMPIIKEIASKTGIITKYSLLAGVFGVASVVSLATIPLLVVPSLAGLAYNGQKLINNITCKVHKDLAFITRKWGNNVRIFQDWTRMDITREIKDYSEIEKAGFMGLQAIIGMSKFKREDKNGNLLTYSTYSHGITRGIFKKLAELGYIENYQEEYNKDSKLIVPKLAFGNIKALNKTVKMYDISFNKSEKEIDIADPELQKAFHIIFGKRGLIQKRGYEIVPDGKGGLSYRINKNVQYAKQSKGEEGLPRKFFERNLRGEGVPTYSEQVDNSKKIVDNLNEKGANLKEDKQL